MKLSIIMPTCRRLDTLRRALVLLREQIERIGVQAEIRVTDDGSGDGTADFLEVFRRESGDLLVYSVHERNRGPAAARNTALHGATGDLLLITGDDILPDPGFIQGHLDWHERHPDERDAVLGRIAWPEEMAVTPFMRWMETGGRKYFFDFPALQPGGVVPPDYFYTANVSLKRSLLAKAGPFDEDFPYASQEDLELGVRLGQRGMCLHYVPELLARHWHTLTVGGLIRRTYLHGYSAVLYWRKVPDHAPRWKRSARETLAALCGSALAAAAWRGLVRLCAARAGGPLLWWPALATSYWIGFSDAREGRPARDPGSICA